MDKNLPKEILVISPSSLIASRFVEILGSKIDIYGAGQDKNFIEKYLKDFKELDITNPKQIESVLASFPGKYVINFAAVTDVGGMEKTRPQNTDATNELEENLGYRVNVLGTQNLIDACKKTGKIPIFISTDFVFDGKNGPYSEDDEIVGSSEEVGWYAWTKILAEQKISASGIDHIILRLSYPYRKEFEGKGDIARNFLKLYDKYKNGEVGGMYPIFQDQIFTPTFIDDITDAVMVLIQNNAAGIYHLSSPELTNFYQFFCKLLKVARGVDEPEKIIPVGSLAEHIKAHPEAKWPLCGGLKTAKIEKLGFRPTTWEEGIKKAFGD